ncbi:MAG: NERD domain-containing protein [Anaerolineales bacterium]
MKRFDQTPFLDANGNLSLIGRLRGMLKYGMDWPTELEAQKSVLERLEKVLEKGFVAIRNYPLAEGSVLVPLILIGPPGLFVLQVSGARGLFEAKGEEWNVLAGEVSRPARINLIRRAQRFARAVQVLLERQGISLPVPVEAVLVAADPGLHVQTLRPAIRIILSDAIERFALSLAQARPVLSPMQVQNLAERLLNPRRTTPETAEAPAAPTEAPLPEPPPNFAAEEPHLAPSVPPFEVSDSPRPRPATPTPSAAPRPRTAAAPRRRGLQPRQWMLLAVMGVIELLLILGLILIFFIYR